MQYCYVCNGQIKRGPTALPSTWEHPFTDINYSLETLSTEELIELGWLPVLPADVEIRDGYDVIDTQYYTVETDRVVETITLLPLNIDAVKQQKLHIIDEYYEDWTTGTFTWNGITWKGDKTAQQYITSITTAIANNITIPAGFTWMSADNTPVSMTEEDLVAMGAAMLMWVSSSNGVRYYHHAQVMALTDVNQIIEYDHTVGWPS